MLIISSLRFLRFLSIVRFRTRAVQFYIFCLVRLPLGWLALNRWSFEMAPELPDSYFLKYSIGLFNVINFTFVVVLLDINPSIFRAIILK